MDQPSPSEWVTLKGDVSLPLAAVALAIDLAEAGFGLARQDDQLLVSRQNITKTQLSQLQRESVQQWKPYLLVVVDYLNDTTYGPDGLWAKTTGKKAQPKHNFRSNSSK